jgi:serine/threonine protein kinase
MAVDPSSSGDDTRARDRLMIEKARRLSDKQSHAAGSDRRWTKGGKPIPGYRLIKEIGWGGSGSAWLAVAEGGIRVVLKRIDLRTPLGQRELRAMKDLAPSVDAKAHLIGVQKFKVLTRHKELVIVLTYVPGGTLRKMITNRKRYSFFQRVSVVHKIALLLDSLHKNGVHRDIKPENILLDKQGNPFLSDFGLWVPTEALARPDARTGEGSPGYRSPEQARREILDGRSDLYSLGVVLYELLCGRKPRVLSNDSLRPPREVDPRVPCGLEEVCMQTLSMRPEDRPQTGRDLADDLVWAVGYDVHEPPHDNDPRHTFNDLHRVRGATWALCRAIHPRRCQSIKVALHTLALAAFRKWSSPDWPRRPWHEVMPIIDPRSISAELPADIRPGQLLRCPAGLGLAVMRRGRTRVLAFPDHELFFYLIACTLYEATGNGDATPLCEQPFPYDMHRFLAAMVREPGAGPARRSWQVLRNLRGWLSDVGQPGRVRDFAAFQLGMARAVSALDTLHRVIEHDDNVELVIYAAMALDWARDRRSLEPLGRRLGIENDEDINHALFNAITSISQGRNSDHHT